MAKAKKQLLRPGSLLKQAIRTAKKLEEAASAKTLRKPLQVVGFGFLTRNRRMAVAIARLGRNSAYESRLLLRSMLEIKINYAWIRLTNKHSRAVRFYQFWPLERLKLLANTSTLFKDADYAQKKRALVVERRKVRHLFRFRDSKGKMQWAKSWASVSSVEARLVEVQKKEKPGASPDPFLYGLYVSFSSATHGSPNSIAEVLKVEEGHLVPSTQPESRPDVHKMGAFIVLAWTIEAFAEDARLRKRCQADIRKVSLPLKHLIEQSNKRFGST